MGDVEVRELYYEGRHGKKDIFSFKISTPIHTYLDTGSREDIIELVQNDIYTVLSCWDDLYYYDDDTDYDWLLIENMKLEKIPTVAVTIAKPQSSSRTCTKRIPVFGWWEEDDDINGLYDMFVKGITGGKNFCTPSCYHCKYCVGVEDYARGDYHFCAYPAEKNDFEDKIGIYLSFETEEFRRYQKNHEGIIKNAFMRALLSDMKAVDRQTRDLEGKLSPPFNKFHGPICSEFDLNLEHMDLEDNGGPFRIVGEVDIVFGLPNLEEIKKEITLNEKRAKIKDLTDKAHALMDSDPNVAEMNWVRIEMNNINSDQALPLIRYLASNFTLHELYLAKAEGTLPINTSHKAYKKIIQKSIVACSLE